MLYTRGERMNYTLLVGRMMMMMMMMMMMILEGMNGRWVDCPYLSR